MNSKNTTSLAKIEANRRNALRSTGPKTSEGKSIVRLNPLKHGLLSKEVVITTGGGREDPKEFKALHLRLVSELQPACVLEEMLVEKIAICYWRLRRSLRCEVGEIHLRLDSAGWREAFKMGDDFEARKPFLMLQSTHKEFQRSSVGLRYLINVLKDVREDVNELGYVSEDSREKLVRNFGHEEEGLAATCALFSHMAVEGPKKTLEDPQHYADTPSPDKCKEAILFMIDTETKYLEFMVEPIEEMEGLQRSATAASLALPPAEALDKIFRYETTIERQLYRAINQLERLQRQRKGEFLPLPVDINVPGDN